TRSKADPTTIHCTVVMAVTSALGGAALMHYTVRPPMTCLIAEATMTKPMAATEVIRSTEAQGTTLSTVTPAGTRYAVVMVMTSCRDQLAPTHSRVMLATTESARPQDRTWPTVEMARIRSAATKATISSMAALATTSCMAAMP